MSFNNLRHYGYPLLYRHIRKTHQPRVPGPSDINELSEVCIDRHEDSTSSLGLFQRFPVAWILSKLTGLNHVMSLVSQPNRETATNTPVDEKFHESATAMASSESLAMQACA